MKLRTIILTAAAALAIACGEEKPSNVTTINGTIADTTITQVTLEIENVLDTVLNVNKGKFSVTVPAAPRTIGVVQTEKFMCSFISDGTPLDIMLSNDPKVTSRKPEISIQERFNAYNDKEIELQKKIHDETMAVISDTTLTEVQKIEKRKEILENNREPYVNHHMAVLNANKDNFLSVIALTAIVGLVEDDKIIEIIPTLSPEMQVNKYVEEIKSQFKATNDTAEGKMFVDFTVNSVVGQTHSIPPQPVYSEVKLSDYVGKGKYILLDFWAPWCGPCCRSMPAIKEVYEKYKGDKFDVVSVAVWERESFEVTMKAVVELGMTWPQINNSGRAAALAYGVESIPHLILFAPDGTILKRGFHAGELESVVSSYLK